MLISHQHVTPSRIFLSTHKLFRLTAMLSFLLLAACQMSPLSPYTANPELHIETIQSSPFKHLLVRNEASIQEMPIETSGDVKKRRNKALNVYIEGDGRPWHTPYTVAWDPTPKKAGVLEMMTLDRSPAIYLGRPCYFSLEDPNCEAIWWTHKRYSKEVIESMNHVLDQTAQYYRAIRLIGHSGGGALAMLIAAQRDDVEALVTLAGNTEITGWARLHDYSPLDGSLNPADISLRKEIRQFHFVGSEDINTPANLIETGLKLQPRKSIYQGAVQIIEGADHLCCWTEHWPTLLMTIEADLKHSHLNH